MDSRTSRELLVRDPGFRFAVVNGVIVAALAGCLVVGPGVRCDLGVVAGLAGVAAAGLSPIVCAGCGLIAWAFVTGFVVNSLGVLTFSAADVERLVLSTALTLLVAETTAHAGSTLVGCMRVERR